MRKFWHIPYISLSIPVKNKINEQFRSHLAEPAGSEIVLLLTLMIGLIIGEVFVTQKTEFKVHLRLTPHSVDTGLEVLSFISRDLWKSSHTPCDEGLVISQGLTQPHSEVSREKIKILIFSATFDLKSNEFGSDG